MYKSQTPAVGLYYLLENSPKKARMLIGWKLCLYNLMETQN